MFFRFNTSIIRYIMIIYFMAVPVLSEAEEILTLKQTISQAINHNRQLLVASERVKQAKQAVSDMRGKRLPHIAVSTAWTYSNSPLQVFGEKLQQQSITSTDFAISRLNNPSYQKNYQSRLGLRLPLFAGGALYAAQQQAEQNAQAAALQFEFQKQEKMYHVIVAYMQALQYSKELKSNQESVKAAKKRWKDAQALQNKGMVLSSDVMDAHVYVLRRQVAVNESNNAYLASLEKLALLMGLKSTLLTPVLTTPVIDISDEGLEALVSMASDKRMDFQALQARWNALSAQRDIAYGKNLPRVDLVASQEWNSATPALKHGNATVGVTVSINLFNGGSDRARQRQAESAYAATQWEIADQRQIIANQVRQAWRALSIAKNRLASEKQVLQQTQESLRILSLRYQQGLETTAHMLDAQVAVDSSRVALLRAQSDLIIAKAALLLAVGILNEGVVA